MTILPSVRRKEIMRIGDDNLFEIGCREWAFHWCRLFFFPYLVYRRRVADDRKLKHNFDSSAVTSHCSLDLILCYRSRLSRRSSRRWSFGGLYRKFGQLIPNRDMISSPSPFFDFATKVVYGSAAERRMWSGRGKVQEIDLRRKHAEYLREMLPKFNRLRRGDGAWSSVPWFWCFHFFWWALVFCSSWQYYAG